MYSYEDRLQAVKLYLKLGLLFGSAAATEVFSTTDAKAVAGHRRV